MMLWLAAQVLSFSSGCLLQQRRASQLYRCEPPDYFWFMIAPAGAKSALSYLTQRADVFKHRLTTVKDNVKMEETEL